MRRYFCPSCGNEAHFENTACVWCLCALGYDPEQDTMLAAASHADWQATGHQLCPNHDVIGCNWLVGLQASASLCASCERTIVIPDLTLDGNVGRWRRLELAKRALFRSLKRFGLPLQGGETAAGTRLRFEFKGEQPAGAGHDGTVMTGHKDGLITINAAEADDAIREHQRVALGEPYRTLLGHFRHETGHYYWDLLVMGQGRAEAFRKVFGDEQADYGLALQSHYTSGARSGWELTHVSSYASAHPWEDFAETWAHYFHIVDGLETAQSYSLGRSADAQANPYDWEDCAQLVSDWIPLTVAMNSMNRSMGHRDFYPFVMSQLILTKLQFVHDLIHARAPASP